MFVCAGPVVLARRGSLHHRLISVLPPGVGDLDADLGLGMFETAIHVRFIQEESIKAASAIDELHS